MNYGSFQSGTEQGLHRNEQPPPTQQGAFPKGKGAVVANAVTPRRLGLHLERLIPYQPGEDRRYPGNHQGLSWYTKVVTVGSDKV